jgi:hypothetical protein
MRPWLHGPNKTGHEYYTSVPFYSISTIIVWVPRILYLSTVLQSLVYYTSFICVH